MIWNPWRGCHKYSEGCKHCYIHKGDSKRGVDTNIITKTEKYYAPVERLKNGEYKMKSGSLVYLCFSSDFLLPDADEWRQECWDMIRERSDLLFLFLTKRINRFAECMPPDFENAFDNLIVGCTVENQRTCDERLPIFEKLPIKHKNIIIQPMLEAVDIEKYLHGMELVVVGGESDRVARVLDYDWVLSVRQQCVNTNTPFNFRQCGSHFQKDGTMYHLNVRQLCSQARKANIDFNPLPDESGT